MSSTHRSSRPRRAPLVRYTNDDSDSGDLGASEHRSRPSRSVRRVQTYRESSDNSSDESSTAISEASSEEVLCTRGTKSRPAPRRQSLDMKSRKRKQPSRTTPAAASSFNSYKRRKVQATESHSKLATAKPTPSTPLLSSPQRVPPWQQLPYHVLVSIMKYAAFPLYEKASRSNGSINWLCSTSLLCRSFHDACMAALLYSPPLYPAWRASGLLRLLERSPIALTREYGKRIHHLDIEVKHLLCKKSGISLDTLLCHTPLLQGIRLYSNDDDFNTLIWAQPTAQRLHWTYPAEMFDRLNTGGIMLKSFEWNGRFSTAMEALETAMNVHSSASFARLRHLSFLNLTLAEKADDADLAKAHSLLAAALRHSSELKSLAFRNCALLDEVAATALPLNLEHLELSHCPSLTSEALEHYLRLGGGSLRTLKLFGNQSMSLGFMAGLQELCPRLRGLEVDMLYVDPTSYRDRDPLYDELLPNGPPTWPTELVTISVENLRQLSAADAEAFLTSLVNSSEHLPFLRKLNIKAILKGSSWRDRAKLRKTWLPKLQTVFLSSAEPSSVASEPSNTTAQRQSSRIANSQLRKSSVDAQADDSVTGTGKPVQPRCEVVNLVLSDQRPSQDQFQEADFLDDEPDDDADWNGRDTEMDSAGYAW
ncbi:hypothetical protein ABEF93_000264 [Exophiala dermatitidis]